MKVSGFSLIRDGVRLGYPFVESVQSLLPLVDELIIAVGNCTDGTRARLAAIDSPKIHLFDSVWDPSLCSGGEVLAQQTNLALDRCSGDWCFYLQGDEVLHEQDLEQIEKSMHRHLPQRRVEGLSFRYLHFRGSYDIRDPLSYRRQIRIVRRGIGARSVGDACGFAIDGRKLRSRSTGARMFHYGWVRPPAEMAIKRAQMQYFHRGPSHRDAPSPESANLREWRWDLRACVPYSGTHPAVMRKIIASQDWSVDFKPVSWFRNGAWWDKFLRRNFASLYHYAERRAA